MSIGLGMNCPGTDHLVSLATFSVGCADGFPVVQRQGYFEMKELFQSSCRGSVVTQGALAFALARGL
jgi:hypothetical protein